MPSENDQGKGRYTQNAVALPGIVEVRPLERRIWVETDFFGSRHLMVQYEGMEPFQYASFWYDYRHSSNSSTQLLARALALEMGAVAPVEHKTRQPDWAQAGAQSVEQREQALDCDLLEYLPPPRTQLALALDCDLLEHEVDDRVLEFARAVALCALEKALQNKA